MYTDDYDLHAEKTEFISLNPNVRNIYPESHFLLDNNNLSLVFVEKQIVKGRKLTSLKPEERAKIFQERLDKHKIDAALNDIKVLLIVKDDFKKSYGYQWDKSNFKMDENIKKLDHDECEIIMKQLEL
ncbi:hypothetical protein [Acinetobacter baumannii]|uniref:hypothetical protein n=1 Tax=Acinetobacter baumannii TaxID=470 RepID=UPI000F68E5D2|nr:hypothetical protein [Acinetobacter baumannii]MCW1515745.1 hypothetical protein [Acinetobacter baumannii]RSF31340.1 hypothetical protein EGU05_16200 [Acinetobacter baumannii]